jgi:hypothetical protein
MYFCSFFIKKKKRCLLGCYLFFWVAFSANQSNQKNKLKNHAIKKLATDDFAKDYCLKKTNFFS